VPIARQQPVRVCDWKKRDPRLQTRRGCPKPAAKPLLINNKRGENMPPPAPPTHAHRSPTHQATSLTFLVRPPARQTGTPPARLSASGSRFGPRDEAAGARPRRRTKTTPSLLRGCPGRGRGGAGRVYVRGEDGDGAPGAPRWCGGPLRGPRGPPFAWVESGWLLAGGLPVYVSGESW
jgi:hypothetical protein